MILILMLVLLLYISYTCDAMTGIKGVELRGSFSVLRSIALFLLEDSTRTRLPLDNPRPSSCLAASIISLSQATKDKSPSGGDYVPVQQ